MLDPLEEQTQGKFDTLEVTCGSAAGISFLLYKGTEVLEPLNGKLHVIEELYTAADTEARLRTV